MSDRRAASQFWQTIVLRLIVIWLIGWATILWFRGCLLPSTRDEMRQQYQKSAEPPPPSR